MDPATSTATSMAMLEAVNRSSKMAMVAIKQNAQAERNPIDVIASAIEQGNAMVPKGPTGGLVDRMA